MVFTMLVGGSLFSVCSGHSYRIIEGSVFETSDLINLFPSADEPGQLVLGKPFTRCFRICREVVFPAPPKPMPLNPRGRAPTQLEITQKNFLPIGYAGEGVKDELAATADRQGRQLRATSARPESPRLLPQHGFALHEWKPQAIAAKPTKEKKEKKRTADGESESTRKKQKTTEDESQPKKAKKAKKEKN